MKMMADEREQKMSQAGEQHGTPEVQDSVSQPQKTRVCSNTRRDPVTNELECPYKGQAQPLDADHFAPATRYADGFKTRCRACDRIYGLKKYYEKQQEMRDKVARGEADEKTLHWTQTHPDQWNAYQKKRYQELSAARDLLLHGPVDLLERFQKAKTAREKEGILREFAERRASQEASSNEERS